MSTERTIAHADDWQAARFGDEVMTWRDPEPNREPAGDPFRTCGYCGSIHPADLIEAATDHPVRLSGSDWKYGWPHKFYVHGIPNPLSGRQVVVGSRSIGVRPKLDMLDRDSRVGYRASTEREATDDELFDAGWHIEIEETIRRKRTRDGEETIRRYERESFAQDRIGDAQTETFAKFYSVHFLDASEAQRDRLNDLIPGVAFSVDPDGRLRWKAQR